MSDISLVYIGQFDRAPFFGGMYWFDNNVPQPIRGDLAAQLLFTFVEGGPQFQVETQDEFDRMLADGYIAPSTPPDGLVWSVAPQAVEPDAPAIAEIQPVETVDAYEADAPATDDATAPKPTSRRNRGASA